MPSEFAQQVFKAAYNRDERTSATERIDAELQEVRAVLSLTADRRHPQYGHCWCRKDLTNGAEPHNEFCLRARSLYSRLELK